MLQMRWSIFIAYVLPAVITIFIQLYGLLLGFAAGLACGGGVLGCDGMVLSTYLIVLAPITGFGLSLLFTGNWPKAWKFLNITYALEIIPFLVTGNLGDVFKNLTWSLPSYAKPNNYPYFFWDVTIPIILFTLSPIFFGGLSTLFRQKKYLILIGLLWILVVPGYFVGRKNVSICREKSREGIYTLRGQHPSFLTCVFSYSVVKLLQSR